jgi:hypothetical protein
MSRTTNSLLKRLTELMPDTIRDTFSNTVRNTTPDNILDTIPDKLTPLSALSEPLLQTAYGQDTTSSSSVGSFFSGIAWQTWLIFVLILLVFGINIFAYLAKGTEDVYTIFNEIYNQIIAPILNPILKLIGYNTVETTKQTINTSATGAKAGIDIVADTTTGAIDTTTGVIDTITQQPITELNIQSTTEPTGKQATTVLPVQEKIQQSGANTSKQQSDALDKALNDASKQPEEVTPEDSQSSLYGKAGWCFIGDDNGNRTCSQVGVNDKCMSGDIFPSQDICVNPNLRP